MAQVSPVLSSCFVLPQNAYGVVWSNLHNQQEGHQVVPTLRAMQLRDDPAAPYVMLAGGSHTAVILSPQGHQIELLSLPVSHYMTCALCPVACVYMKEGTCSSCNHMALAYMLCLQHSVMLDIHAL